MSAEILAEQIDRERWLVGTKVLKSIRVVEPDGWSDDDRMNSIRMMAFDHFYQDDEVLCALRDKIGRIIGAKIMEVAGLHGYISRDGSVLAVYSYYEKREVALYLRNMGLSVGAWIDECPEKWKGELRDMLDLMYSCSQMDERFIEEIRWRELGLQALPMEYSDEQWADFFEDVERVFNDRTERWMNVVKDYEGG